MTDDLAVVLKFPETCDEEVTREGELQPCMKTAVAVRRHEGSVYAVCAYHARGDMVPLSVLFEAGRSAGRSDGITVPRDLLERLTNSLDSDRAFDVRRKAEREARALLARWDEKETVEDHG